MTVSAAAAPGARHPWVWAVLYFPYGLTFGFPAIAIGFIARRSGMPLSAIAGVVGMSFLAAGWKFIWAPVGDYTLSRKRWYVLAVMMISAGLIALTTIPLTPRTLPLVSVLVLATSVAGTFLAFATEGLMVHNTPDDARGRAAGWFQSGNQFGQTAGGGVGLWLMTHVGSPWMAGAILAAMICACALVLPLLREPERQMVNASVSSRASDALRNLAELIRSRAGRIGLLLAVLPIGTGAAEFLFGSLGGEWHAPADTVSAVLGLGGGIAIVAGCFAGGRLADRLHKPTAYAISCALGLAACVVMALSPRTAGGYTTSTLFYTFTLGMVAASYTGLVLAIVGHTAAATKINLFFALNTLFSLGMLRVDAWAHDGWGTNGMLYTEALVGVVALVVFGVVVGKVQGAALVEQEAVL
ncbi:MAG: MFS transporter [Gemmatimonadota bacterium]|nr:MFS transporter [Gemmatimonadota bacterium]